MPKADLQGRSLAEWANLGESEFASAFAKSAVLRIGWPAFRRNVLIAIGNSDDPALLSTAIDALGAEEVPVRAAAVWAVGQLGGVNALRARRRNEPHADVVAEIDEALLELGS